METIAPGVHQVAVGSNAFVVDGDEGVTLIDTGLPKREGSIAALLDEIGRNPSDVGAILITHAHVDHGGGAAALKALTGSTVFASEVDAPALEGRVKPPPPPMGRYVAFLFNLLPGMDPVVVDRYVEQGSADGLPEGFCVIETPGHTSGHVCYRLDREGGIVFAGDVAVAKKGEIQKGFFNAFGGKSIVTAIEHLSTFEFEIACFGHSGPLTGGASAAFARFSA
jgi:glyoxylase-like metal-dependent hydrolase (beta-lactamase superfamily II)